MNIADTNLLLFQVGPVPCCVDSNTVQIVIEPPSHITAIPGSNAFRPGLMVYAKRAVSVYDVRTKFNLPTEQRGKVIIVEMGNQLFGFWVDRIQAVMLSSEGRWQILPAECPKELFESLFVLEQQLIFKTSFEALAKAQVNTQTQKFIKKLLDEEEKKNSIKTTPSQPSSPKSPKSHNNKRTPEQESQKFSLQNSTKKTQVDNANSLTENKTAKPVVITKPVDYSSNNQTTETARIIPTRKPQTKTIKKPETNFNKPRTTLNNPIIEKQTTFKTAPLKNKAEPSSIPTINNTNRNSSSSSKSDSAFKSSASRTQNKLKESITQTEYKDNNKTTEQSSFSGLFLILFFISLILGAGWLMFYDGESKTKPTTMKNSFSQYKKKPSTYDDTDSTYSNPTQADEPTTIIPEEPPEPTTESESPNKTITNTLEQEELDKTINTADDVETHTVEHNDDLSSISHSDSTITITINDTTAEFNDEANNTSNNESSPKTILNTENNKTETAVTQEQNINDGKDYEPEISIEIKTKSEPITKQKTTTSITTNKIIHIIVKGDTLWHIAKRYVNNPYKYPQLAKLSRIKNPDLIYPGNRVIIIIKKHKTKSP